MVKEVEMINPYCYWTGVIVKYFSEAFSGFQFELVKYTSSGKR